MKINKTHLKNFAYFFVLFFIMTTLFWFKKRFGIDINSYIYHIHTPMDGMVLMFTESFARNCVLAPFVVSALLVFLATKYHKTQKYVAIFFVGFLCLSLYVVFKDPVNIAIFRESDHDFYAENYVNPNDTKIIFKEKRNVLILTLESLERSYENIDGGGGQILIENLINYEKNNLSFDRHINSPGINFTFGAEVAMLCGVPLLSLRTGRAGTEFRQSIPNITCLTDILAKNEYKTLQIQSSSLKFSGFDKFAKEHSFSSIYGKETFGTQKDETTYEKAKEILTEAKSENKNYFVYMATIDTHEPTGVVANGCEKKGDVHFKDVLRCADKMAYEFIEWYRKFDPNAVIIVVGDHLARDNGLIDELKKLPERNAINFIINSAQTTQNRNRVITWLDLFPTIIEAMGGEIEGRCLGLGVSLFSGGKTLVEENGVEEFNIKISTNSKRYGQFFKPVVE